MTNSTPHESPKAARLGWLGGLFVRVLGWTVRTKVTLDPAFLEHFQKIPVIFVFWHNRLLLLPKTYARWLAHRPVSVLTSASKDGAIIAGLVKCFGMGAVRGSSSRRGAVALVQMKNTIQSGVSMAITPDGPRGPVYKCAQGPVKLAQITGAPLIPVTVEYSRCWRLKSWDRFAIPKPFASAQIHFQAPIPVPAEASPEMIASFVSQIENVLHPQDLG